MTALFQTPCFRPPYGTHRRYPFRLPSEAKSIVSAPLENELVPYLSIVLTKTHFVQNLMQEDPLIAILAPVVKF